MLKNSKLLITGGTGSFGQAVLRRLLDSGLKEIRVFSRDEKKQDDLRREIRDSRVRYYIGDVRDSQSISHAMHGIDFVFHAAALKQVPSCEFYPIEAVKTNVIGTDNVLTTAAAHGVQKVVVLSTDKAVYPVNAMGMSKGLMEKVMVARSRTADRNKTLMCGTRYGNVLASRGSVIPLFIEQIIGKQPLTVTDPHMTRFVMSLDEAVDLVLFAFTNANQGDLFVQKAPAATVGDLAQAVKKLFSANNPIRVLGTRHGEKKDETLLSREELARAEDLGTYYRIPADGRDLNYELYFSEGQESLSTGTDYSSNVTQRLSVDEIVDRLLKLPDVVDALQRFKK